MSSKKEVKSCRVCLYYLLYTGRKDKTPKDYCFVHFSKMKKGGKPKKIRVNPDVDCLVCEHKMHVDDYRRKAKK